MSSEATYTGGCHCGKVRYEVTADLSNVYSCNCSLCAKRGWILAFTSPEKFKLIQGDGLTDYQFNKKVIHHLFCPECGTASFSRGTSPGGSKEMIAVNVRCLDGVDLSTLQVTQVDGKSL